MGTVTNILQVGMEWGLLLILQVGMEWGLLLIYCRLEWNGDCVTYMLQVGMEWGLLLIYLRPRDDNY